MIGHLPRIFDLAGALLTTRASFSFATSSDVFTSGFLKNAVAPQVLSFTGGSY